MKSILKMLGPVAWLATAAGLQMAGALLFFKTSPDPVLIVTSIFITFGVISLNKFTDSEDGFNYPERRIYFQTHSTLILLPISFLAVSLLLLASTDRLYFFHIVLIAAGILYSVNLIPHRKSHSIQFIRLKNIPFVKNISVSLLWSITPFTLAASRAGLSNIPSPSDLTVVLLAFFSSSLINTTSCDVRDIAGDRHAGITTVATRFGKRYTGIYLLCFGLMMSVSVCIAGASGQIGRPACTFFIGTMLWTTMMALPIYSHTLRVPKNLIEPLIDSEGIICGAGLIILSFF